MTLTELMVALFILGVVLTAFLSILASVQRGYERASGRSQSNDQVRLAVEELDREIRSGNVLYDPATESDPAHDIYPNMSLRIYTQSNANSRPGFRCVQWRISSTGQLQNRSWWTNWRDDPSTLVSSWRVIAEHLTNRTASPQVPAFSLATSSAYGGRIVNIDLLAAADQNSGTPVEVQSSVEGRDTTFGYPTSACADIPPY